jgi:hypothetical protein
VLIIDTVHRVIDGILGQTHVYEETLAETIVVLDISGHPSDVPVFRLCGQCLRPTGRFRVVDPAMSTRQFAGDVFRLTDRCLAHVRHVLDLCLRLDLHGQIQDRP